MTSTLSQPLQVGNLTLQHRLAMAPLTRVRNDSNHVPTPMMQTYYAQRASVPGTLIVSEATFIDPRAGGLANAPGIYNAAQIEAWKPITAAVHEKSSFIYCQLWALGRAANAKLLEKEGPYPVISASDLAFEGGDTPRALTESEIEEFIEIYVQAAKNAIEAGFDGVEIHGANGYLLDQFLQDVSNKRTDSWGGTVENRAKFGIEVARRVSKAIGNERVGYRVSPYSTFQGMKMANPTSTFSYLATQLKSLNLAYLHIVEGRIAGNTDVEAPESVDWLVDVFAGEKEEGDGGVVLLAGGFTAKSAGEAVVKYGGRKVVVVFGRYFISNPDLVFRVLEGVELAGYDRKTFYVRGSERGYTDYPFSEEWKAKEGKVNGRL